jgi:hypothetical protein
MRRYAVFIAQFALASIISGPFVVSSSGRASGLEWAHIVTGFATVYLVIGLLLVSAKNRKIHPSVIVALAASLLEAIPGMPQVHAAVSPILFAALAWAALAPPSEQEMGPGSRRVFALPALVLLPIFYGVGFRHQTSGFISHLGAALPVAGLLIGFCMVLNERHPANTKLRRASNLTITVVLFQIVSGIVAFMIRLLEIEGGLLLAYSRTVHITGAALVLAASLGLAIQYRRSMVEESRYPLPLAAQPPAL